MLDGDAYIVSRIVIKKSMQIKCNKLKGLNIMGALRYWKNLLSQLCAFQ